jgi:hypothetical protein
MDGQAARWTTGGRPFFLRLGEEVGRAVDSEIHLDGTDEPLIASEAADSKGCRADGL